MLRIVSGCRRVLVEDHAETGIGLLYHELQGVGGKGSFGE